MAQTPTLLRVFAWLLRGCAVAALVSLVLEFGFPLAEPERRTLHIIEFVVVAVFVADVVLRLAASPDRRSHARRRWLELVLAGVLAVELLGIWAVAPARTLARLYLVVAQVYLVLSVLLSVLRADERFMSRVARPAWILLLSFLLLIAAGTGLLLLPNCTTPGTRLNLVDAIFTAASASCVTGLSVRDTGSEFSFRGQLVLIALIQIGGLGLPVLAIFLSFLRQQSLQLRQMALVRDLLSVHTLGNLGRFLTFTLVATFVAEALGALALMSAAPATYHGPGGRAWWGIFHSVSAFCNAGFALSQDSLSAHATSPVILPTIAALFIAGGLGFPVLLELLQCAATAVRSFWRRRTTLAGWIGPTPNPLSLHTRLVLGASATLMIAGTVLFYVAEAERALAGRGVGGSLLLSFFHAVTPRTAGFNALEIGRLQPPTLMLLMVLMAAGAAPVSTGGGVKVTAVATLFQTARSMIRNREHVEAFGRTIPRAIVNGSVAVVSFYAMALFATTALLATTQRGIPFVDLLFESVSALSTVGLSTGVTSKIDGVGRLILSATMLVGRVGPLAVILAVVSRPTPLRYRYPQEPVIVA